MTTKMLTVATVACVLAASSAIANPTSSCFQQPLGGKELLIKGSTTLRPIAARGKSLFNTFYPGIDVTVEALGSTTGVRALIEGECAARGIAPASCDLNADGKLDAKADIAQSSRPISQSEINRAELNGLCIVEQVVGLDGLGIIVNLGNGADNLSANPTIKFIFENDMNNACPGGGNGNACSWAELGIGNSTATIVPVSRTPEGGTFGSFRDLYGVDQCKLAGTRVNQISPGTCATPDNPSVVFVGSNDEINAAVAGSAGAIGYIGISFQAATVKNVKVAKTNAGPFVVASFDTVQNGSFAFRRNLYNYTVGVPQTGDLRALWLDYVQSLYGQANVFETGFVPVAPYAQVTGNPATRVPATTAQLTLEPFVADILKADDGNIAGRLALIANSIAIINDPASTPAQVANATTDLIESQFAIEEYFISDNRLVRNLLDRATDCLVDCQGNASKAGKDLAKAEDAYAAAQAAVAGCSPTFPVTCGLAEYQLWLKQLAKTYDLGAKSLEECSGINPKDPKAPAGSNSRR